MTGYHWAMSIFDFCIKNVTISVKMKQHAHKFLLDIQLDSLTNSFIRSFDCPLTYSIFSPSERDFTLYLTRTFYAYFAKPNTLEFSVRPHSVYHRTERQRARDTNCIMYAMNIICSHLISLVVQIRCIQNLNSNVISLRPSPSLFLLRFATA